ncbi:hypothetical protein A8B82_09345 [Sulfitobacter sp. EhC04]|uniref:glutathione S-transferase family protein n=1 Tax=Sulfitobacter sp. EhC04 TaxID=1849168 RepID=UPI0007F3D819|nr:glutathione S-transferase family protein [Sulfitobacter sp. EhC04]OAN78565.1 hypothetical protein A8B82_09345 [Sulfitobacter sp. EhC04]
MADGFTLIGFRHSVYTRIVRMALIEMGLQASYIEVDPFTDPPALVRFTPLGRVPVLRRGDFSLTETAAILRYLARTCGARHLMPNDAQALARMDQVFGIVDTSLYWPLVRQVFSNGFYAPLMNESGDFDQVATGIAAGRPGLKLLDTIAAEGLVLRAQGLTLADLHLAPVIDYLTRVKAGAEVLADYPDLSAWWSDISDSALLQETDPFPGQERP